jgi:hypothetical protein
MGARELTLVLEIFGAIALQVLDGPTMAATASCMINQSDPMTGDGRAFFKKQGMINYNH